MPTLVTIDTVRNGVVALPPGLVLMTETAKHLTSRQLNLTALARPTPNSMRNLLGRINMIDLEIVA
jgi:hypothetical protein